MMSGLKEWAKKNRLTAREIGEKIGVSSTVVYRHYKGGRVSRYCHAKYKEIGVPLSITNKLWQQGL
jgi:hypothetical protein